MLIREFTGDAIDPILVRLVAATSQLKSRIDNRKAKADWSVEELLQYLKDNEVILDKSDLLNMINNPPMNNIISNIQGDEVIFKGNDVSDPEDLDPEKRDELVKKMAKSALANAKK